MTQTNPIAQNARKFIEDFLRAYHDRSLQDLESLLRDLERTKLYGQRRSGIFKHLKKGGELLHKSLRYPSNPIFYSEALNAFDNVEHVFATANVNRSGWGRPFGTAPTTSLRQSTGNPARSAADTR
jgi:hypothetical protein